MSEETTARHGGNIYAAMRGNGGGFADFLDYSANINPLGLPASVRQALIDSLDRVTGYPDPDAVELREAIAANYQAPIEWIETGNGAVELIYLLCRVLSPRRVAVPAPTFSEYGSAAQAAGVLCDQVPLDRQTGFAPDVAELARQVRPGDLWFLCNPNNPTGVILERTQWEPLVERAKAVGAHLVFDESFLDFRPTAAAESCRTLIGRYDNVIILHSLTKFLAVPGLRLGFMLARPELADRLKKLRDPWNVNVLAQVAGVAGLADDEYRRRTLDLIAAEKENLRQGLQALPGVRVWPPAVNFILADIAGSGWTAPKLATALREHRILIRNCANFGGLSEDFIRVAVKDAEKNRRLLATLNQIWGGAVKQ
jgi:threonine-phosphate decarboxylase